MVSLEQRYMGRDWFVISNCLQFLEIIIKISQLVPEIVIESCNI